MSHILPNRQVHLDFHTSEHNPAVGDKFDADAYVQNFLDADVESVVTFAKCHHGWSYYDTTVGERHPSLHFDLLRAQFDACKAAGIQVPIYLSVGWDERAIRLHQDWRQVLPDGTFFCMLGGNLDPAWSYACLNSPYLDELCDQIEEVVKAYPDCDGLWLDIIRQNQCCCGRCRLSMTEKGLDYLVEADRLKHADLVTRTYYERTMAAVRKHAPNMGLFHNTAMVPRGERSFFDAFSHMEIEAVPTGGWGYDHLPMSAKYLGAIGYDAMGVTVRFHVVWGELGGYKTSEALRFEAMTMLAHGARVCVGDHLDPSAIPDKSAYRIIGKAFAEVSEKQPFVTGSTNVADVAILSSIGVREPGAVTKEARHCVEDEGALKILQESHFLFDVIDQHCDFATYRVLVLPDRVKLDSALAKKLSDYVASGGQLLMSGESGLAADGSGFALDISAELRGLSPFNPTFLRPHQEYAPDDVSDPFIFMGPSLMIAAQGETQSLGDVFDPEFNRTTHHFNGHINAPARREPSGNSCGIQVKKGIHGGGITYLPHFVFSLYRELGPYTVRQYVAKVLRAMLAKEPRAASVENFPASGVITMRNQPSENRYSIHLLYGAPKLRGTTLLGPLESVDDLPTLVPANVEIAVNETIQHITTYDGVDIPFETHNGIIKFRTPPIAGHGLYILNY